MTSNSSNSNKMTEAEECIANGMKVLLDLFDSAEVGHTYSFGISGRYSSYEHHKIYIVIDKKKHNDWSYSLLLRGECGGVIYRWIVPIWSSQFSERIISITPISAL